MHARFGLPPLTLMMLASFIRMHLQLFIVSCLIEEAGLACCMAACIDARGIEVTQFLNPFDFTVNGIGPVGVVNPVMVCGMVCRVLEMMTHEILRIK